MIDFIVLGLQIAIAVVALIGFEIRQRQHTHRRLWMAQRWADAKDRDRCQMIDNLNAQLLWYAHLADDRDRRLRELEAEHARKEPSCDSSS